MLCPEVWTFRTNKRNIFYQSGNYDNKAQETVNKIIRSLAVNEMVSVILPGCETIPESIKQLIDAADHYLVRNFKLRDVLRTDFVEAFLKRGNFTGISGNFRAYNTFENVFFINPDGKLILLVNKDLYQILGLEGQPARVSDQSKDRFEITIDLKNKDLFEQSKFFNRVKNALSRPEIEPFDFYLSWESIDATVCPSSVAKFFNDCGYEVEQHSIRMWSTSTTDLKIPIKLLANNQIDADLAHAVGEYFAIIMLACETNDTKPNSDLNLDNEHSTQAVIMHCKGLLTADFLAKLIELARLSVDCKSFIFNVNGYEKDLVGKSNGYTISLLNNTKYFLFKT